jgi:hypothetical protein
MGMCDPKAVRAGTPWYQQVRGPGFMGVKAPSELKPITIGRVREVAREIERNASTSNVQRSQ